MQAEEKKAMAKTKRTFIDGNALTQAIYGKGMRLPEASVKIGRAPTTITNWVRVGDVPSSAISMIELILGIEPSVYVSDKAIPRTRDNVKHGIDKLPINGKKLKKLIYSVERTIIDFSAKIEVGSATPHHWIRDNSIPTHIISRIENFYGIKYEQYAPSEDDDDAQDNATATTPADIQTNNPLTKNDLYMLIYAAVIAAGRELIGEIKR